MQGSTAAFDLLYDRYFPDVYAFFVVRLPSRQDAEDLTSEVFMRCWRSAGTFRGEARVRTWLLTIARNALTDFRRKQGKYAVTSLNAAAGEGETEFVDLLPDDGATPDELALRAEEYVQTWDALDSLPEIHRTVLTLRFVQEQSYELISAKLELPLGTVKSRLYRAVAALRKAMDEQGGSLPTPVSTGTSPR